MPDADSSSVPPTLSGRVAALAGDPSSVKLLGLWRVLTLEDRALAMEAAADLGGSAIEAWMVREVARVRHVREQTVRGWPPERLHEEAARIRPDNPDLLHALFMAFHKRDNADLPRAYLDPLGVPHEDGPAEPRPIAEEDARRAAQALLRDHAPDAAVVYLLSLGLLSSWMVPGLAAWLPDLVGGLAVGDAESAAEPDAEATSPAEGHAPESTDEFTTLDQQMVRMIVDAAQRVEGALDAERVEDLVDELISLNSTRHRSFFHRGFADVVLGREPRAQLRAENAVRMRWYWAGHLHGLARAGRWEEIVGHFDEQPLIQALGESDEGPSSTTARIVFDALCRQDRPGEAAAFLSPVAVAGDEQLFDRVRVQVQRLLGQDRAAEARSLADLLKETVDRLVGMGAPPDLPTFLEARRRRAHCFRQLGALETARSLLQELLDDERDPDIRSMVLTDLGLVEGGFRTLADVTLPTTEDRVSALEESLARGEALFTRSANIPVRYSSHGRYCLGVLAMCRHEWEAATRHLDLALSLFESQPDRYDRGNLLEHARAYLGLALALALITSRAARAGELIAGAASDGVAVPRYWLSDILEGLRLASEEVARDVAEALLGADPQLLDDLLDADVGRSSQALATALLERSVIEAHGRSRRAADLRRALPFLLHQERAVEAAGALDELESAAREGTGAAEFIELLADPASYEPAWEAADALWARVNLLGTLGRPEEAVPLLEQEFWRALYSDRFAWQEESEGLLESMREFGASPEQMARPESALAQKVGEDEEPFSPVFGLGELVRVLVVGGDERQARYADEVESRLRESHPGIRVSFIRPGWGSNWASDLDEVKRKLPGTDAVVILRFVRTEFGKQLRRSLGDVPWRGCAGAGRARMIRSVLLAAEEVRRGKAEEA